MAIIMQVQFFAFIAVSLRYMKISKEILRDSRWQWFQYNISHGFVINSDTFPFCHWAKTLMQIQYLW